MVWRLLIASSKLLRCHWAPQTQVSCNVRKSKTNTIVLQSFKNKAKHKYSPILLDSLTWHDHPGKLIQVTTTQTLTDHQFKRTWLNWTSVCVWKWKFFNIFLRSDKRNTGCLKKLSFTELRLCRSCCQLGRNTFDIRDKPANWAFADLPQISKVFSVKLSFLRHPVRHRYLSFGSMLARSFSPNSTLLYVTFLAKKKKCG